MEGGLKEDRGLNLLLSSSRASRCISRTIEIECQYINPMSHMAQQQNPLMEQNNQQSIAKERHVQKCNLRTNWSPNVDKTASSRPEGNANHNAK